MVIRVRLRRKFVLKIYGALHLGITQRELANSINVPYQRVNEMINGKRGITPSTALRLSKVFGVSADFWMNIQLRWDLYFAKQTESDALSKIRPLPLHHIVRNDPQAQRDAGH